MFVWFGLKIDQNGIALCSLQFRDSDLGCVLHSILVCVNLLFAICLDFVFPIFNILSDLTIWVFEFL